MSPQKRIVWIDWLKCFAIMFVIYGHLPMDFRNKAFICSFHMPLFFMISGYLYKPSGSMKKCCRKCIDTLLIPYLLFNILFYPYWYIMKYLKGEDVSTFYTAIVKPILGVIFCQHECEISSTVNGVTWFLIALTLTKIITEQLYSKKHRYILFTSVIVLVIALGIYLNSQDIKTTFMIQSFMKFLPFFFLGIIIKDSKIFERYGKQTYMFIAIFFLCMWFLTIKNIGDPYHTVAQAVAFYMVGISGSIFMFSSCRLLDAIHSKVVTTVSVGNIVIFGFHWMCIGTINHILKKKLDIEGTIEYNLIESVLLTMFITSILYPIVLLTQKKFPILMGKRKI